MRRFRTAARPRRTSRRARSSIRTRADRPASAAAGSGPQAAPWQPEGARAPRRRRISSAAVPSGMHGAAGPDGHDGHAGHAAAAPATRAAPTRRLRTDSRPQPSHGSTPPPCTPQHAAAARRSVRRASAARASTSSTRRARSARRSPRRRRASSPTSRSRTIPQQLRADYERLAPHVGAHRARSASSATRSSCSTRS